MSSDIPMVNQLLQGCASYVQIPSGEMVHGLFLLALYIAYRKQPIGHYPGNLAEGGLTQKRLRE